MEGIIKYIIGGLNDIFGKKVIIFLISLLPILELRGGILAASEGFLDIPLHEAIPICFIANFIPIPFILLLIKRIFNILKRFDRLKIIIDKLEKKALSKSDKIKKYEFFGLVIFVGIPLPGTGAWTGALIAALLDIDIKKASCAILLGLVMASIIMSIIYMLFGVLM